MSDASVPGPVSRLLGDEHNDDLPEDADRDWVADFARVVRWFRSHGYHEPARGWFVGQVETLPTIPTIEAETEAVRGALMYLASVQNDRLEDLADSQSAKLFILVDNAIESAERKQVVLSGQALRREALIQAEAAGQIVLRSSPAIDGPSFAKALVIEAIQNDGRLLDGKKKLTVKELLRRLVTAGVRVTRTALYENKEYEGVRKLAQPLKLFERQPERRSRARAVPRGSKDKQTGLVEAADTREQPPDQVVQ